MAFSLDGRQARRAFLLVLAGGALTIAGCQTRPGGPVGPEPGPTLPPVKPSETQRNMVAVIVPLTGGDAAVGQSIANAANLALLDTGEKSIRITVHDSAGPGGPAAAAERPIGCGNRPIPRPPLAGALPRP